MWGTLPSLVTPKSSLPVPYKVNSRSGLTTKACVTGTLPGASFQVSLKNRGGGCGAGPRLPPRAPGCWVHAPVAAHHRIKPKIDRFMKASLRRKRNPAPRAAAGSALAWRALPHAYYIGGGFRLISALYTPEPSRIALPESRNSRRSPSTRLQDLRESAGHGFPA